MAPNFSDYDAELNIEKIQHEQLPYTFPKLGKSKGLMNNAQATIYSRVRTALRKIFAGCDVTVTCSASCDLSKAQWRGRCTIDGKTVDYTVSWLLKKSSNQTIT